jgi:uncharacterized DUF497 family protein
MVERFSSSQPVVEETPPDNVVENRWIAYGTAVWLVYVLLFVRMLGSRVVP